MNYLKSKNEIEVVNFLKSNKQTDTSYIDKHLKTEPKNQFYQICKARILVELNKVKKAKKILKKIKGKLKEEYQPYFYLGKAELNLRQKNELKAVYYLSNALSILPHFTEALELLMELYFLNSKYEYMVSILNNTPNEFMSPKLIFLLGKAYYFDGDSENAKIKLEESIDDYPYWESDIILGYIEKEKHHPNTQIILTHFENAFSKNPNDKRTCIALIGYYLESKDFNKALQFQLIARDIEIEDCIDYLESEDYDPEAFHALYEPDLLEADLAVCALHFINKNIRAAEDIVNSPFYWEYDHEYFQIIKRFVKSVTGGNIRYFEEVMKEFKVWTDKLYWMNLEKDMKQVFLIINRDNVFEDLEI